MKVRDLIEKLQQFDGDLEIGFETEEHFWEIIDVEKNSPTTLDLVCV